jgi:modulator of FtsH protease
MNDFRTYDLSRGGVTTAAVRNRVLRNTYWLLALSMIPTVFGAWIGISTGFAMFAAASPGMTLLLFFAVAMGLIFAIERFRNSGVGVVLLLAFTFFMGLMLSRLLSFVLGMVNGPTLIMMAFGGTAIIFGVMATVATVSKRDFAGLGQWLFMGVIVLIVASIANMFLHLPALMLTVSVIAVVIFSAYILFDLQRVINGGETSYVSATLRIYLDLYNVFTNLLVLLSVFGGGSNRN